MSAIDKKELKRIRMMRYFIDAAIKIIDEEGIDNLTIRKVADMAGYNSATIYNYFENLDHLVSYAAVSYLKDYYLTLDEYISEGKDSYERFILVWRKFCIHSFKRPKIYKTIFFANTKQTFAEIFNDYFRIYPLDFGKHDNYTLPMLKERDIYARNKAILIPMVEDGILDGELVEELNDLVLIIYRGVLAKLIDCIDCEDVDMENEVEKTVGYINKILDSYIK
ncbi:transcriptional regulator, TetR family [Dethiosulfatibacter aminovorans DSM 17477]|uniref:Transcriptional regulator, TetR family n=1 Tax=Dethiosulfatibacter aminovorans DSM 17477 TaxID=1121476 RepID=A0A1M6MU86_9FIRM|nr:TetR/AcrR family transcriptional regulator [Dethiosulfatibacter aminovorans]SHJ86960.1 transcriptional regulator, TetR family [Dethiosulfatibacter aminovorans DSM 17477]